MIHFFRRAKGDDPGEATPAREFLDACPIPVRAKFVAILQAVAAAPPPSFSGGGKWEAMHGSMNGYFEARTDGPNREHFRLFCMLDRNGDSVGLRGPSIVLITGKKKPFRSTFSETDYARVRALGAEFLKRSPRSVA